MHFLVTVEDGTLRRIDATEECDAMNKTAPLPTTRILYRSEAKTTVQCMTLLNFPSPTRGDVDAVAIAHRNGTVSIIDAENGEVLGSIEASSSTPIDHKNIAAEEDSFVSIECIHGVIGTCTSSGLARFTKLSSVWGEGDVETFEFMLPAPISVMKMHPTIPGVIAFGGKENELQIWSSKHPETNEDAGEQDDDEEDEEEEVWSTMIPLWKARNVKNDHLDLRVPVWISDLQFLPAPNNNGLETTSNLRLLVSTRFRQLRIYETQKARRPTRSAELSEYPIARVSLPFNISPEVDEAIFCDSNANILHVNVSKVTVLGAFKGFSGAVNSITTSATSDLLVAGGMDCFLRAYSISKHQQICSIFLGSRVQQCLVLPAAIEIKEEEDAEEVDEDEDVWDGLETVNEDEPRKKKVRRA